MRIALASIHPRPLSGQIEGLVGLAQALEKNGHTVHVVSAFPDQQLLGANRIKLGRPKRIFLDQPVRMTRILARLVRLAPRVNVIQLNLPTPAFSIFADLLQTFVRAPVIAGYEAHLVSARDLLRRDRLPQAPEFYLPRLIINNRLVARWTVRRAACYIVSTQYQKSELISLGMNPHRIHILPTILPRDKLTRAPRNVTRATLPPGHLVTYAGHYNHIKGVDVLVRAFQLLAPRFPDARLVLAWSGAGSDHRVKELLRASGLRDRVIELGHLRVPDLLGASDVVVLPYRLTIGQAAQPATLLEALAANVPIVATDLPLLRELTVGGKTALLVPPDDLAALAAAIERVLNDPLLVRHMRRAQRDWIQQIQPEHVVGEYERLYAEVIGRRQARVLCSA